MIPPVRKPSKVPFLSGNLADYVAALHPSLFTNPSYFTPTLTGITGTGLATSGVIIQTARAMFLAILISGATIASAGATVSAPLNPITSALLEVAWMGVPVVEMDPAQMDQNGLIALPEWDVFGGNVLITGYIQEA